MALPKIEHKLYEHYLTGAKKTIKFRPFTVGEQKILLIAKEESKDSQETMNSNILGSVGQIIQNCTLGKVDPDKLCTFDLEDLFLQLRAKSVGEIFTVRYSEDYKDEQGRPQTHFIDVKINLEDVKVKTFDDHEPNIKINEQLGMTMRYPTFKMLKECKDSDSLTIACIDSVYNADEVFASDVYSIKELKEFYDDLETSTMLDIKKFFDTMPKLSHTTEVVLHDGTIKEMVFEGLDSFFVSSSVMKV